MPGHEGAFQMSDVVGGMVLEAIEAFMGAIRLTQ
jgi:hypothetical protein